MGRSLRPNKLSLGLFALFLVFLITPLAASRYFGFTTGFFTESQKYGNVFNRGVGHVFMWWNRLALFSLFGAWFVTGYWFVVDSFGVGVGSFARFRGPVADTIGLLLMSIGPFLYYVLSCRIAASVKSELSKKWILCGVGILIIVLPTSYYSYSKAVASEIRTLGTLENCTIRCVFPAEQQLQPGIDACRSQCNTKQWPSDDQRISCWNHCGDALEAARAECQTRCTSSLR